jgi:hypothetical protein
MEAVVGESMCFLGICPEGLRKITKNSARIAGIPVDIRTDHLPNSSLHRYLWTNLFCLMYRERLSRLYLTFFSNMVSNSFSKGKPESLQ